MRRALILFLAAFLVAGCGDDKKPDSAPAPEPGPEFKQIPGQKKKNAPGITHLLLLGDRPT